MAFIRSALSAILYLLPATSWAATLLASHYSGTIYTLSLSASNGTGNLSIASQLKGRTTMPSWMTLDSETGILYVTDESSFPTSVLSTLSVQADGSLKPLGTAKVSGGEVHGALYGGSDGKGFFATAEYDPSTITTYKLPLASDSAPLAKLKFSMNGIGPVADRQERPHPHSTFTDPTGKFLLSADLGADLLRIFSIDASTGKLTECPSAPTGAGDGPRHGAWWSPKASSTDGLTLYIINELASSVAAYKTSYPANGGCLSLPKTQSVSTYPAGKTAPKGSKAAEVHVWGNYVYASNRNDQSFGSRQDSLATYAIDQATGGISFVEQTSAHSYFPRTFAINKAGDLVAIGGQTSSTVVVVSRDVETGKLGGVVAEIALEAPGTVNQEDGLSAVVWDE